MLKNLDFEAMASEKLKGKWKLKLLPRSEFLHPDRQNSNLGRRRGKLKATIERYVEVLKSRNELKAILATKSGKSYEIIDGNQRFYAYEIHGVDEIPCYTLEGLTAYETYFLRYWDNNRHGQPSEKHEAIEAAVEAVSKYGIKVLQASRDFSISERSLKDLLNALKVGDSIREFGGDSDRYTTTLKANIGSKITGKDSRRRQAEAATALKGKPRHIVDQVLEQCRHAESDKRFHEILEGVADPSNHSTKSFLLMLSMARSITTFLQGGDSFTDLGCGCQHDKEQSMAAYANLGSEIDRILQKESLQPA